LTEFSPVEITFKAMNSIAVFSIALTVTSIALVKKIKVGPALIVASIVVLALTENLKLTDKIIFNVLTLPLFYWVLAVITGVSILGSLLKHLDKIPLLVKSLESILRKKSIVVAALPAMIGALPMPGGAYLSAPMVEKAGKDTSLSKEKLTVINHWFRHQFEFFLPLYPGFILAVTLCKFETINFSMHTFPLALAGTFLGGFFLLKNEKFPSIKTKESSHWKMLFSAFWPVMLVFIPSLFGIPFLVSLALSIFTTTTIYRIYHTTLWKKWFTRAFNFNSLIMISGIFLFKETIELTKLSQSLAPELTAAGLPLTLVLILVPLLAGLLAGLGVGFVGICYPVLLPLITVNGNVSMAQAVLIYGSGWVGMMLSPAHLCLTLTNSYFDSNIQKVFKHLIVLGICLLWFLVLLVQMY